MSMQNHSFGNQHPHPHQQPNHNQPNNQKPLSSEKRKGMILEAYSYHTIRPKLHFASKVTGALFFIYLVSTSGYADWFLDNYYKTATAIIGLFGFFAADWLEDMVSRATKNFSMSVFRWNESASDKWIAIGAAIVLVPLFTIGAVTSFSGVQGNINKGELGLDQAELTLNKIGNNGKGATDNQEANLDKYLSTRKKLRGDIEQKIVNIKKAAAIECKGFHPEDKTARANCALQSAAAIDNDYSTTLDSFDNATNATQQNKQLAIDGTIEKINKDHNKLTALLYGQLDHKNAQIEWVGWLVGWIAMFFEFFALIDALLVYGILYRCNATEKEMIKEGIESENIQGLFPAMWGGLKRILFFGKRP